jgi:hypothetical protein
MKKKAMEMKKKADEDGLVDNIELLYRVRSTAANKGGG